MAKVDSNPFAGGTGPEEDNTKIDKEKFKQKMRQVEAVDKTDPEGKAKKRKPSKEEDLLQQAKDVAESAAVPNPNSLHSLLSSSQAPTQSPITTSSDVAAPEGYTPQGLPEVPPPTVPETSSADESDNLSQSPSDIDNEPVDTDYPIQDWEISTPELPAQQTSPSQSSQTSQKQPTPSESKKVSKKEETPHAEIKDEKKALKKEFKQDTLHPTQEKQTVLNAKEPKIQSFKHEEALLKKPASKKETKASTHLEATSEKKEKTFSQKAQQEKKAPEKIIHEMTKETEKFSVFEKKESFKTRVEKKELDEQEPQNIMVPTQSLPPMTEAPQAPPPSPSGSFLTPQVHELFQTMVGLVMVKQLTAEGLSGTQTEVSLNNPEYEKSPFYGLKIIISEFKTAPGAYNIELQGTQAQNALLVEQSRKLISALNDNRYNLPFTVNRLDISLKKEESDFLFKRKESVKGDQKGTHDQQNK
jgi:hypothetical protein